ncbi:PASTA domain-containing protein [Streptomyces sp. NPDC013953]|uniref:PASTA domain-containing protein n=1 Tax=Streptomyces sp. NPDC013953 TaxID=3364868 RepID=UPI0036F936D8
MTSHDQPPQQSHQPAWGAPAGAPAGGPKWARKRVIIPAAVVLFLIGVGIGGSGDGRTTTAASPEPAPTVTRTVTASPAAAPDADPPATGAPAPGRAAAPAPTEPERATVPDFVGMVLQTAQDTAQAEGFFLLTSHDSTGAGRMQLLDRNWKVCSQSKAAGTSIPTATAIDFGAVKLEESCP